MNSVEWDKQAPCPYCVRGQFVNSFDSRFLLIEVLSDKCSSLLEEGGILAERFDVGIRQCCIRETALSHQFHRFHTPDARNPDGRMGLLDRLGPDVTVLELEMFAISAERSGIGPDFDNQVSGFAETLPSVGRVDIIRVILRLAWAYLDKRKAT